MFIVDLPIEITENCHNYSDLRERSFSSRPERCNNNKTKNK